MRRGSRRDGCRDGSTRSHRRGRARRRAAAAGVAVECADLTSYVLWRTSLRGVDSHGVRLLPHYVAALQQGRINPEPNFRFERTSVSTAVLDADHGLAHAAGITAMREAVKLAQEAGTGLVSVKHSNHCGALSPYALEAASADMVGMACTHANSTIRTPNSTRAFFGANPFCVSAPMLNEDPLCFDITPTYITINKVRQHRESRMELPPGCAADVEGVPTTDPEAAVQLIPLGDYKGFGMAMIVDILCGLLSGMPVGRDISRMFTDSLTDRRYLGQFYGAIRIDAFEAPDRFGPCP
jgi:ureidoglycolate dehydrogenase (NAD+)